MRNSAKRKRKKCKKRVAEFNTHHNVKMGVGCIMPVLEEFAGKIDDAVCESQNGVVPTMDVLEAELLKVAKAHSAKMLKRIRDQEKHCKGC
jgi:hypothetical protein